MTTIYADATVLIALGNAGRLDSLTVFDGTVRTPKTVVAEVTTEPAASALRTLLESGEIGVERPSETAEELRESRTTAKELLNEDELNGDVAVIEQVLHRQRRDDAVGVLSDDRRVRRVAEGLGATVTGTIGVVVRAVSDGELTDEEGMQLVERLDERGLHMTGELRQRAIELVEDAATERD